MSYIPTIHTFEDDINENRGVDEPPIVGGVEKISKESSILVPEENEKHTIAKKLLVLFSVLFLLGSISLIGYYFYNKYKIKEEEKTAIEEAQKKDEIKNQNGNFKNDLMQIFNRTGDDMAIYLKDAVQRKNIIILTIDNQNNSNNFSLLYAYILANKKDLGSDLFDSFGLEEITKYSYKEEVEINLATNTEKYSATSAKATSTKKDNSILTEIIDTKSIQDNIDSMLSKISDPTPISGRDLIWESKTINNQDLEIANAGVISLIYGFIDKDYLIFTTSLKDFFDTADSLK